MNRQPHSIDYLLGVHCAMNIEKYTAEIAADFQCLGGTSEEFEKGFSDAMLGKAETSSVSQTKNANDLSNNKKLKHEK